MKIGIPETLGYSVLGLAVVFMMLIILMAIIKIMGKVLEEKKAPAAPKAAAVPAPAAAPAVPKAAAPGSAGSIDLHSVEPKTAAMIMAIVADELGAPINELRFISIREI